MTEIILTSSVLILLLVLLRRALRGRVHPGVQYALWLLAAARLLIPGTLFDLPVSVTGAAAELQTSIREAFPEPEAASDSPPVSALGPSQPPNDVTVSYEIAEPEITISTWEFTDWPGVVWKTGMAATGGALALSNLTFAFRLRKKRKRLTLSAAPWSGNLPVYEADGIPSPCLFGIFRPAIYLNEAAMDAEHPEHILAHEYAHYRHGDHIWALLRGVCLTIHWYNPLVWWAATLSRRDCELACDAAALRRLGGEESIDYGKTLLGMVSRRASPAALLRTATTMTAGKRAMQERLALIIRRPRMRKATFAAVALAACILVSCAFGGTDSAPAGTEPSQMTPLMEFPGLHWNDSVETVLDTLGITQDQILEQGELNDDSDSWGVVAENVPGFGAAAEKAYFYFQRYEGSAWGLYSVRLDYPNDEDFDAVRAELIRQYGPGSETPAETYSFTDGGSFHADQAVQTGPGLEQMMLDIYGQETMDRRAEIRKQPGPHSWYWSPDSSVLPEEFLTRAPAWLAENWPDSIPLETAREYFRLQPMVRVVWTDAAPLNWARLSTTFNQVCLDASEYVFFLQRIAAAGTSALSSQDAPAAVYLAEPLSSQYRPGPVTDPETVGRLWELYQSFTFDGTAEELTRDNAWSVFVSFQDEAGAEMAHFSIFDGGLCWLEDDYETIHVLRDGQAAYDAFRDACRTAPRDESYLPAQPEEPEAADPAEAAMRENARSIVEQYRQGVDPGEWLPLMNYMDWGALAQAAVEAGLDDGDGTSAITNIIWDIEQYIDRQGTSLTQAEYSCILSASTGLDGAPAEGYSSMIYRLYTVNPSQFAYVVLEQLPEAQQNEVLDLFRGEWMFHKEPYQDTAPAREEAIAQLEADLETGVSASPSEMTLTGEGETFLFLPVNAFGVYAASYTSSDPGVAAVDEAGTVTAVAPGQAVITLHYEGTGGPADFTCAVTCDW